MAINELIRDTCLTPADLLDLVAGGQTYEQILDRYPDLSYKDIFAAAKQAAELIRSAGETTTATEMPEPLGEGPQPGERKAGDDRQQAWRRRLEKTRVTHPRAYEKWTPDEDEQLTTEYQAGQKVKDIARTHGRQPSAIGSRLVKLGLREPGNAKPPA